jgi:hypothetical protein
MTDIEAKALALINEVRRQYPSAPDYTTSHIAICRTLEQHEAFKQEVSDAAEEYNEAAAPMGWEGFDQFIIPKPDPLVEVIKAMQAEPTTYVTTEVYAKRINAALDALGFEIREKGK